MKWIGQQIYDQISRFRNDVYFECDTVTFTSANADDPQVIIKNTYNDVNSAAQLQFIRDRGAAATAGTNIGEVYFTGEDAAQNQQEYGRVVCEIDVATNGQESGILRLGVANHDGGNGYGLSLTGGSVDAEVDVTIGLGAGSVTTVAGHLYMQSTHFVNTDGQIQVALQSTIDHDSLANFVANEHIDFTTTRAFSDPTIHASQLPTLNQNTTGSAATLTTARTIGGVSFNGSANINLPGVNATGTVDTSGQAATVATIAGLAPNTATTQATQAAITTCANLATVGTVTTGSWRATQVQIISANFKDNQGTTETFLPLSAQPEEKTGFANEQTLLLMPTGGNVKEIIVRANYNTYTSENIVFKVYTRAANKKINAKTQIGSDITIAAPTQNTTDSNNTRSTGEITHAYVAGDVLGISMTHQSTGPTNANDRTYVTIVLENDLSDLGY